jgi:hypothetical protein
VAVLAAPGREPSILSPTPRREEIPDVDDGEQIIRHLHPKYHWDPQWKRPSTGAFRSSLPISVDREGYRPLAVIETYREEWWGFARLVASVPRELDGVTVDKDPIVPDPPELYEPEPSLDYNPGHTLIHNLHSNSHAKKMRDAAEVLKTPSEPPAD